MKLNFFNNILVSLLNNLFGVKERYNYQLPQLEKVLVIRPHNQFGDMLASIPLFRAIKEKYPNCSITLIASPENHYAVEKNEFLDSVFLFNKKKLFYSINYIKELHRLLNKEWDVVIVPFTVAISKTSCILGGIANSTIKIGISSLNGIHNDYDFFFNYRFNLDWKKHPDSHVSDFIQELVRPFSISTKNFQSLVTFDNADLNVAKKFLRDTFGDNKKLIVGLHVGAGKPPNRWSLDNFIFIINYLKNKYDARIYLTGSKSDNEELNYIKKNITKEIGFFLNHSIPELAAIISESDLFITNDTGVMHVAGSTNVAQISIFGPTNPFNWAPLGNNKYFLRKSDLIDEIKVEEVIGLIDRLLLVKYFAALDLGTNSFHLTIVKKSQDSLTSIYDTKEYVRIGESVFKNGFLISEDKIELSKQTIKKYYDEIKSYNAVFKIIATSAIRDAINGEEFIALISKEINSKIEIIDGIRESYLIYEGVKESLDKSKKYLIIDLGGGSTEFIIADKNKIYFSKSINLGVIRLMKKYFNNYEISIDNMIEAKEFIKESFSNLIPELKEIGFDTVMGVSGTFISIAKFNNSNEKLEIESFNENKNIVLSKKTVEERRELKLLEPERADIIPAGFLIIENIFKSLNIDSITISYKSIRDGLISELISSAK
ncbi:MAG: glycosyltransferase family 9 protein [Melioribacteraceae bacterium]